MSLTQLPGHVCRMGEGGMESPRATISDRLDGQCLLPTTPVCTI